MAHVVVEPILRAAFGQGASVTDSRRDLPRPASPCRQGPSKSPGLIEVYPHPALVELANAPERLCYKVSKTGKYWPALDAIKRRERLFKVWAGILELLDKQIAGVLERLPDLSLAPGTRVADLKKVEDMLDAIVCAWVAIRALEGHATPFGDRELCNLDS